MKKILVLLLSLLTFGLNAQGTKLKIKQLENPGTSSLNLGANSFSAGAQSTISTLYVPNTATVNGAFTASNFTNVSVNGVSEVYFIGDSFTAADIFPSAVTASLGTNFYKVNLGISGQTTTQMLARIRSITGGAPKYVVVLGGANDLQGGLVSATTITNNLQSICTAAKNAGANVILVTTSPFGTNAGWTAGAQTIQNTVNTAITSTAGITNVDYRVNIYTLLGGGTNTLSALYDSGDGLHPNVTGHSVIATAIYTTVGVSNWTISATTPTVYVPTTRILEQNLSTTASPYFYKLYLKDSLSLAGAISAIGNIISNSLITANGFSAVSNSTLPLIYVTNSILFGSAGNAGSFGSGGTSLKITGGSTYSNVTICTPNFPNGLFQAVNSTTGTVMLGDISSMTDNGDRLQIDNTLSTKTINVGYGSNLPTINLNTNSLISQINFRNSAGTNTYLAISANASTGELKYFARSGGYFPTFYSNGSEAMRLTTTANLLINTTTDAPSSKLTISSTTQGVLFPRMTTTQKNAISSPATGLVVYDTTLNKLCVYTGSAWETVTSL